MVFDIDVCDAAPPRLPDGYRLGELPPGDRAREVCHLIDTAFGEWPDWEGFDDWATRRWH